MHNEDRAPVIAGPSLEPGLRLRLCADWKRGFSAGNTVVLVILEYYLSFFPLAGSTQSNAPSNCL